MAQTSVQYTSDGYIVLRSIDDNGDATPDIVMSTGDAQELIQLLTQAVAVVSASTRPQLIVLPESVVRPVSPVVIDPAKLRQANV